MRGRNLQSGMSQIGVLISIAILLMFGYGALHLYGGGQKDMVMVEARGVQMTAALSAFRRDQGSYPDALAKLVPKYAPAVGKCPSGAPMDYQASAGEYVLSCPQVAFKLLPYRYDSRSRSWGG